MKTRLYPVYELCLDIAEGERDTGFFVRDYWSLEAAINCAQLRVFGRVSLGKHILRLRYVNIQRESSPSVVYALNASYTQPGKELFEAPIPTSFRLGRGMLTVAHQVNPWYALFRGIVFDLVK